MKKTCAYLFALGMILFITGPVTAQDVQPFVGTWSGIISAGGMEIGVILNFSLDDAGNLEGTLDVPDQGAEGLALGDVKVEGKTVSFIIDDPGAPGEPTFSGTLDETGKKLEGTFSQGGVEGSFSLDKE
jgi:hypothetical protein